MSPIFLYKDGGYGQDGPVVSISEKKKHLISFSLFKTKHLQSFYLFFRISFLHVTYIISFIYLSALHFLSGSWLWYIPACCKYIYLLMFVHSITFLLPSPIPLFLSCLLILLIMYLCNHCSYLIIINGSFWDLWQFPSVFPMMIKECVLQNIFHIFTCIIKDWLTFKTTVRSYNIIFFQDPGFGNPINKSE